ncbi:DUF3795 domain-containing protein [Candidatus Bathyarchaeota archaeon]|nr:MAG: DUF3795 domain-containing protein [Candidatus Bathyarchaeota archaeon]
MHISVCGIACEVCILYRKGICRNPCEPKVDTHRPIPRCAAERGVRYCSSCKEFPCDLYEGIPVEVELEPGKRVRAEWRPYSKIFLEMLRTRLKGVRVPYRFLL